MTWLNDAGPDPLDRHADALADYDAGEAGFICAQFADYLAALVVQVEAHTCQVIDVVEQSGPRFVVSLDDGTRLTVTVALEE